MIYQFSISDLPKNSDEYNFLSIKINFFFDIYDYKKTLKMNQIVKFNKNLRKRKEFLVVDSH